MVKSISSEIRSLNRQHIFYLIVLNYIFTTYFSKADIKFLHITETDGNLFFAFPIFLYQNNKLSLHKLKNKVLITPIQGHSK